MHCFSGAAPKVQPSCCVFPQLVFVASIDSEGCGEEAVKKAVFIDAFLVLTGLNGVSFRMTWLLVHRVGHHTIVNMILNNLLLCFACEVRLAQVGLLRYGCVLQEKSNRMIASLCPYPHSYIPRLSLSTRQRLPLPISISSFSTPITSQVWKLSQSPIILRSSLFTNRTKVLISQNPQQLQCHRRKGPP